MQGLSLNDIPDAEGFSWKSPNGRKIEGVVVNILDLRIGEAFLFKYDLTLANPEIRLLSDIVGPLPSKKYEEGLLILYKVPSDLTHDASILINKHTTVYRVDKELFNCN